MDSKTFAKQLAAIVKSHRKQSNLTQAQLAIFANVGKTVVYDIEHAKKTVQMNTIIKVLSVLNISIQFSGPLINNQGKQNASSRGLQSRRIIRHFIFE